VRVALAGKGGAGKTTLSATLARLAARGGRDVVAVDADSNPNLAVALGLRPDTEVPVLPSTAVSRRLQGPALSEPVDVLLDRHALRATDGVRLLGMGTPGHAGEGCLCAAHSTVSALLGELAGERLTVVDLEASPEHLSRGTARHVDLLLLVAEPYYRSLEAAKRMAALARELPVPQIAVVANKLRSASDADTVEQFCGRYDLPVVGRVPFDTAVLDADAAGAPVLDRREAAAVVTAVEDLLTNVAARR
jgi:CO dehydrogenase maturation factor